MNYLSRSVGITILSAALMLTQGCNTPGSGAATGTFVGGALGAIVGAATGRPALGALIGAGVGAATGSIIGSINRDQQARLRQQSPQTLATIQHNDAVYQQQKRQPQVQPQAAPVPAGAPAQDSGYTPVTVDDIRALNSTGVKKEVIITEIERSKSVFTEQDIASLQQSDPNIDPAIIECMKKSHS